MSRWIWPKILGLNLMQFNIKQKFAKQFIKDVIKDVRDNESNPKLGNIKQNWPRYLTLLHMDLVLLDEQVIQESNLQEQSNSLLSLLTMLKLQND